MHRILIALSCIIFVIGINGASIELPSLIDEDAVEMAGLMEKCWSLKPAALQQMKPLAYCKVIDKCCLDEHHVQATSRFFPFLKDRHTETRFNELIGTCINSTAHHKADQWCQTFRSEITERWEARANPDVKQFSMAIAKYRRELMQLFNAIDDVCNDEEIHAVICLSNKELMPTCAGKILRKLNDINGYEVYQKIIVQYKTMFIDVHQKLSKMFKSNEI